MAATQLEIYWSGVRETASRIRAEIAKSNRQPRDGTCILVSLPPMPPNRFTEASIYDPLQKVGSGAKCVNDGTHRLASDAEVEKYQSDMAAKQADRMSGTAAKTTARL